MATNDGESSDLEELITLAARHPEHADIHFRLASAFDRVGKEAAAIPRYRRAIALGLPEGVAPAAFLGLGSSLRTLGRYDEAVHALDEGARFFPRHQALKAFLGMALYNVGRHTEAVRVLLDVLASGERDGTLEAYARPIRFYAERLDEVWPE